jgi:hypothetical protein
MPEPEHYTTTEAAVKLRMTPDGVLSGLNAVSCRRTDLS